MNKKLKKALYMFGFALPIVAIPIITVACGTQTSQVEPTPTPAPEKQPNKQPEIKEPEIKKMEEVKPDLSVLKQTDIDEKFLSKNLKDLLENWKEESKFEINSIKENSLFSKLIQPRIRDNNDNNVNLKDDLKYSDISQSISELKFVDLFDISSLNIENLDNSKKLDTIKLTDVASDDLENLINEIKVKNNETFAKQNSNYDSNSESDSNNDSIKKKIKDLINKKSSSSFQKIDSYLENKDKTFNSTKLKEALKKFKFSDLINIEKLQDSLSYIKES